MAADAFLRPEPRGTCRALAVRYERNLTLERDCADRGSVTARPVGPARAPRDPGLPSPAVPPTDQRAGGIALIVASAASFGAMAIFARAAYDSGAEPVGVLAPRFAVAAAVLVALARLRRTPWPRGRRLAGLLAAGGVGYTLQAITFFTALEHASAGLVALLLYLYPAIVTVLSVLVLGERMTRVRAAGVALALGGTALTIGPVGGGSAFGIVLGVAAACIYSVYILVNTRLTAGVDAIAAAAVVCTGAAASCLAIAALTGPGYAGTTRGWLAVAAIAVVCTVVAITTFFAGLRRVGATDAAALSTFEPVVTVALAAVVLGERVSPGQLLGGGVILAAVVLLSRSPAVPKPV